MNRLPSERRETGNERRVAGDGSRATSDEIMQNKPNFHKNRAIISYGKTKDYKNEPPFLA